MAKYLILKHYRMPEQYMDYTPMDQWSPDEVDAHVAYMNAFADKLKDSGEFVDSQALSPESGQCSPGDGRCFDGRRSHPEARTEVAGGT